MRVVFSVLLFVLASFYLSVGAQPKALSLVDSLTKGLAKATNDTDRMYFLYQLDEASLGQDPAKSLAYEQRRLVIAQKMKWGQQIAASDISIARALIMVNKDSEAIRICQEAYDVAEKAGERSLMLKALQNIGGAYQYQSNIPAAEEYNFRALKLAEELKDTDVSTLCLFNIGVGFYTQADYEKARAYYEKVLPIAEARKDLYSEIKALDGMGSLYVKENKMGPARQYYSRLLSLYKTQNDSMGIAYTYAHILATYSLGNDSALYFGLKAQEIWDRKAPDYFEALENLGNIGSTYYMQAWDTNYVRAHSVTAVEKKALLLKAESYLTRAITLAKKAGRMEDLLHFSTQASEVQALMQEYKPAYENLLKGYELSDSLYSQENKNKIAGLEEKHEVALRDQQLEIGRIQLAAQKKQRAYLIAGLLLLAAMGGLLYWQNITRKRTNTVLLQLNNELDEANEVKTKFFGILNHDLRAPVANLINFLRLQDEDPDLLDGPSAALYSARVRANAENLLFTMEDLLLWSKGQMKSFKPHLKKIGTEELFGELRNYFSGVTDVSLQFEASAPILLFTDEHYLKTIMRNLTGNAIKALAGRPAATIVWKAWEEGGKHYLSITDNGPGVNDQQLIALYDDSAAVGIRSGLGLHVIRDLARAISCAISVRPAPGGGTEFQLSL